MNDTASKDFKITRRWLEKLKAADGSDHGTRYADTETRGFFASVYASGRVSFGVRYRANGIRRELRLGEWPSVTPEDARKLALGVLGGAARGEDAAEKKKAAREAATKRKERITFKEWRTEYVDLSAKRVKRLSEVERYLTMPSEWDGRALADLTARDVEVFRNKLALRGATQANRWLGVLRASLAHALRLGHVEKNVAANVQHLRENPPRTRTLTADEEKRLRAAIATWPNPFEKTAFTLLMDCGARLSEVLKAKWEDFDLDEKGAGTWRIPSPKSGHPQAIPILPHVGKIVAATPKLDDAPFVVVGRVASVHRHDLRKPWKALMAAAEIPSDFHVHDTRRSFGLRVTKALGIFAASKLLRHSNSRITENVYAPLSAVDVRGFAEGAEKARLLSFKKKAAKK